MARLSVITKFFLHTLIAVGPFYGRAAYAVGQSFSLLSTCACPNQTVTYQCSTVGRGATIWLGTALECQLVMLHTHFLEANSQKCTSGGALAFPIGVINSCYTSQLNVTFNTYMDNTSVICSYDNGTRVLIGRSTLKFTSDPLPPERIDLVIKSVNNQVTLLFSWNHFLSNGCPSQMYNIVASNCGRCPNATTTSSVTCMDTIANLNGSECTFAVQTVVCRNIQGNKSANVYVHLAVPNTPLFHVMPIDTKILTLIYEVAAFNISNEIDGSAISYSIFYTDAISSNICGSATISRNTCQDGVCCHIFDVLSSFCPHAYNIMITTLATNILGDGPVSSPSYITLSNLNSNRNHNNITCNCSSFPQLYSAILGISLVASLLLFLTIFFIIVSVLVIKDRAKIQNQLTAMLQENRREVPVYEEINLNRMSDELEANENIAYGHILQQRN